MEAAEARAFRLAGPEDVLPIAELHVAAWRRAYRGLVPGEILAAQTVAGRAEERRRLVCAPGPRVFHTWVVTSGARVAGFAVTGPGRDPDTGGRAEIHAFYVHPDLWGRGHGSVLMDGVLAELADRGWAGAVLWVLEDNLRARRFYDRRGFVADGGRRFEPFGPARLPELRMRRGLEDHAGLSGQAWRG